MSVRRVGLLAAVLSALLSLGLSGRAAAAPTPADPYNPDNIKVSIGRAHLTHVIAPNYITMDIVVTKGDGSPPTAKYRVFMTFHEPGKDPTDNPIRCQQEHFNDPTVARGVYRCTAIISKPGRWEFIGTVNQPGTLQRVLKVVSVTLDIPDAATLQFGFPTPPARADSFGDVARRALVAVTVLALLLVGTLAILAVPRLRGG